MEETSPLNSLFLVLLRSIAVGWMRICGDDQWDLRDGKSICKTIGAPWASDTYMVRNMDTDVSLIMAVYCSVEDEYFLQCERNLQMGCPSSDIAVLDCGEGNCSN